MSVSLTDIDILPGEYYGFSYILLAYVLLIYVLLTHLLLTYVLLIDVLLIYMLLTLTFNQVSITGNRVERLQAYVFPPLLSLKVIFPHSSKP